VGATASLAEILGAFRAMTKPLTGLVIIGATGEMHQASADFAARIQAEFPGACVVVATSGPRIRPAAAPGPRPAGASGGQWGGRRPDRALGAYA
jgi:hypothetical protein